MELKSLLFTQILANAHHWVIKQVIVKPQTSEGSDKENWKLENLGQIFEMNLCMFETVSNTIGAYFK